MIPNRYRQVLAIPGVTGLTLVTLAARIPLSAVGILLTLHVVSNLDRGYGAAGLVGAAVTVGNGCGAPLLGRLIDRRGLRPALLLATVGEAVLWTVAPGLGYQALLGFAGLASLLTLPAYSVSRQCLATLVPADQHRQAFAIDAMSVELSYMLGPALGVLLITQCPARVAMAVLGAAIVAAGIALLVLDPPVHRAGEEPTGRAAVRPGLPRFLVPLAVTITATAVIGGCDVAVVAHLRASGDGDFSGLVIGLWSAASLVGGFVFGMIRRPISPALIVCLLAATAAPVGLASGWQWLALAIVPTGLCCAPSIAATTHAVSELAPPGATGEIMGWYASALTAGIALGAPLAGAIIDRSDPTWGFALLGAGGTVIAGALAMLTRRRPPDPRAPTPPARRPRPDPATTGDRRDPAVSPAASLGSPARTAIERLAEEVGP